MMFHQVRRLTHFFLLGLSLAILVIACQTASIEQPSAPSGSMSAANGCQIVEHTAGETEICGQPYKVVALSPHILDIILALGVQPAGFAQSANANLEIIKIYDDPASQIPYLGKWVTTEPMAVGNRNTPSLESLTLLQPDLILGEAWQDDNYSLMTQIAPTLLFDGLILNDGKTQFWRQNIEEIARALGREEQATKLLAARDKYIVQAREALQPVLQAYPRVLLIGSDLVNEVSWLSENITTGSLLKEIGFEIVQPEGVRFAAEISWEKLSQIETDIMMVLDWNKDRFMQPEASRQEKLERKPILNSMPVFQQDRVFFADHYLWGNHLRGPLSERLVLEALPDLLLTTVADE
ncbi:MAG: ABC transporter substrate-binding protein [Cyanobacteria bacterium P01_F01_bin.53]